MRLLGPFEITELLIDRRSGNRPCLPPAPQGIVSHCTGDPGTTARQVRDYFNTRRPGRESSAHYLVDEREFVRCVPEDEVAYHAGPLANGTMISIELCEPRRQAAYERYVRLHADICRRYGFGVDRIKPHSLYHPVNWPEDPGGLFPWELFLRDVADALGFAVRWHDGARTVHVDPVAVEVVVDGRVLGGDVPPRLVRGRTLVSITALAELLGWQVQWDEAARRVSVRTR